ncbi:glycosyltransferase family 39 protein [Paenibacillus gorillae]|uniref:glycosyltransferase family 39 protein n=1 Tax=Paenibacillus gorillae TaxID=1243662 RepID=UPI0004B6FF6E|nr:glycosyltransferase family 39 protein [Paenibacillus gorillae]
MNSQTNTSMGRQKSNTSRIDLLARMKQIVIWLQNNPLLTVLFGIGIVIRLAAISSLPGGLNQDEASIGYDAYAILHYGVDRNGSFLPVHLIAWGSGQNALYAYLSMPFIYLFGLNTISIRIVSAIAGVVTLFLFYAIARRFIPDNRRVMLFAAFLIVICPWHIMMSRWALESNLMPALVLLAVYFACKATERPRWLLAFSITMALSLYAYGTAYFFAPLFVLSTYIVFYIKRLVSWRRILMNGAAFTVLALPILLFVIINRYSMNAITALVTIPKLTVPRVEQQSSIFGSDMMSTGFSHMKRFFEIIISQNDGLIWNALPKYGYMYPIALPLIILGLATTISALQRKAEPIKLIILLWLAIAVSMAFIISDANINRINVIFYPLILLAVAGVSWLAEKEKWATRFAVVLFTAYFILFSNHYVRDFQEKISPIFFESFGEAIRYASDATDGTVYITNRVNMPYIYVLLNERIDPREFKESVVYANPGGAFQQVQSFGRYRFEQPVIHDGEKAAYLFANGDPLPEDESRYEIKRFKHYSVVTEK